MEKKRVVVIGGGYAGAEVIKDLAHKTEVELVLVDKNAYHYLHPEIHYFIAGIKPEDEVCKDLESFAQKHNASFIQDEVQSISIANKTIQLKAQELTYDYLVIAIGAKGFVPPQIKGGDQFVKDVKSLEDARVLKNQFEDLLAEEGHVNIAVAGGGLSGVELIAEMACKARDVQKDNITFTMIEGLPSILPLGINKGLVAKTQARLDELGIKCQYGQFITEITEDKVLIGKDPIEVPYDMLFFVAGVIAISDTLSFNETDAVELNKKNQFLADEYLRLKGQEHIFVGGDNTELKDKNGHFLPPSGQIAKMNGQDIAKNIINHIHNNPLEPFQSKTKGVLIALGEEKAIGQVFGIKVGGLVGRLLKRFSFKYHSDMFK